MTHRELISLVNELREELGSDRAVLEAFARAAFESRNVEPHERWTTSNVVTRADVASLLTRDDVLGAVYQALNASSLEAAYRATTREKRKFTAAEIPAVTGLYTPLWLAEHLVRETLERPWREADPKPRVCDLTILDPACGTMNFGLAAADVLREMYLEEMANAGRPGWPIEPSVREESQIGPAILRHNLHGVDVDPTALWLAELSLRLKLGLCDDAKANLVQADALVRSADARRLDVVVTNPPFASARNLPAETVRRLKKDYPAGWRDLYACFIERCIELARPDGGRVGMLTMQSFMFTGAFEALRERIDATTAIESIVHLGPGLFPGGNPGTLQTVAFALRREPDEVRRGAQRVDARSLVAFPIARAKRNALDDGATGRFDIAQRELAKLPRKAWAYWASPAVRNVFATVPKLCESAPPRQGLATTDNARFVRYWWEVEPTASDPACRAAAGRWFPYAKSGRFRRWYEAPRHRVNWQHDGQEIKAEIARRYPYLNGKWEWVAKNASWYGQPGGITYSYLTSGRFSARRLETGSIFDVAGSCVFPPEGPVVLLGILNTPIASELLGVINPTVNFQVGDLAELPVPRTGGEALVPHVTEAIELQRRLDAFDGTSTDFVRPAAGVEVILSLCHQLSRVESQISSIVIDLYGFTPGASASEFEAPDPIDLARRQVSYAIGRAMGRWGGESFDDDAIEINPLPRALLGRVRDELSCLGGDALVDHVERELGDVRRFIEREFYAWHVGLYLRRPVYWAFGDGDRACMLKHDRADARNLATVLRTFGGTLQAGWSRSVDDGVAVNLAPVGEWVADRTLRKALRDVAADLSSGRLGWSATARGLSPGWTGESARARPRSSRRRASAACRGEARK